MQRFHDLVHGTWSTDARLTTDANGTVTLPAFYGTYVINSGQKKAVVEHPSKREGASTTAKVTLR